MCIVCRSDSRGTSEISTGVEIEIVARKGGQSNFTYFNENMLCHERGARYYPDATPVAEIAIPYVWELKNFFLALQYGLKEFCSDVGPSAISNWQFITRSSSHIHIGTPVISRAEQAIFAGELAKLQAFFVLAFCGAPGVHKLSWRTGEHPYNPFKTVEEVMAAISAQHHDHWSVAYNRGRIEFRLPDGTLNPIFLLAGLVLIRAVYRGFRSGKRFPFWEATEQQINRNVSAILTPYDPNSAPTIATSNTILIFNKNINSTDGEIRLSRRECITFVLNFYKEEIQSEVDQVPEFRHLIISYFASLIDENPIWNRVFYEYTTLNNAKYLTNQINVFTKSQEAVKAFYSMYKYLNLKVFNVRTSLFALSVLSGKQKIVKDVQSRIPKPTPITKVKSVVKEMMMKKEIEGMTLKQIIDVIHTKTKVIPREKIEQILVQSIIIKNSAVAFTADGRNIAVFEVN